MGPRVDLEMEPDRGPNRTLTRTPNRKLEGRLVPNVHKLPPRQKGFSGFHVSRFPSFQFFSKGPHLALQSPNRRPREDSWKQNLPVCGGGPGPRTCPRRRQVPDEGLPVPVAGPGTRPSPRNRHFLAPDPAPRTGSSLIRTCLFLRQVLEPGPLPETGRSWHQTLYQKQAGPDQGLLCGGPEP